MTVPRSAVIRAGTRASGLPAGANSLLTPSVDNADSLPCRSGYLKPSSVTAAVFAPSGNSDTYAPGAGVNSSARSRNTYIISPGAAPQIVQIPPASATPPATARLPSV